MPRNRAKSGLLLLGFPPGLPELLCGLHGDAADVAVQGRPLIGEKSTNHSESIMATWPQPRKRKLWGLLWGP